MAPVEPKLQHEPHTAWSLTGVTAPKMNNKIVVANSQLRSRINQILLLILLWSIHQTLYWR